MIMKIIKNKLLIKIEIILFLFFLYNKIYQSNTITKTKSGLGEWIDKNTPLNVYQVINSRGKKWRLVMSDEFNEPGRDFRPGKDHLFTSIDMPDGVNSALQYYSSNMTSTFIDPVTGRGYFQILIIHDIIHFTVYNLYINPPGYENKTMYYRAGMVQSWNKFCFQGGLMEVSAKLPGAVSSLSNNPDLSKSKTSPVTSSGYYPTWPGIWLLGNLGRALFSESTDRMWPWSFNECNPKLAESQRINACMSNPGFGLNSYQGRGAPEIDLLEGGGTDISSSIQIAPGMPNGYRLFPAENLVCFYSESCTTIGSNNIGVPSSKYAERNHKSWYQGLRYSFNPFCSTDSSKKQSYSAITASLTAGIKENKCSPSICPASYDINGDLSIINNTSNRWNINEQGSTCFSKMNAYMGAYLCDVNNQNSQCSSPRSSLIPVKPSIEPFNYQMDALSANWPIHIAAYTDFLKYQLEWQLDSSSTGSNTNEEGYVRWMIGGVVVYEIPSSAVKNPPQSSSNDNYKKIMIEEPMYIIFNVALSTSWGARPPNPGKPCRGENNATTDPELKRICDDFPLKLQIDYIRVYQDPNNIRISCDPSSHPTKIFIEEHIEEYQNPDNLVISVAGGANCNTNDDCTLSTSNNVIKTGICENKKCKCSSPSSWAGPRCITAVSHSTSSDAGPSLLLTCFLFGFVLFITISGYFYLNYYKNSTSRIVTKQYDNERKLSNDNIQYIDDNNINLTLNVQEIQPEIDTHPNKIKIESL